MVAGYSALYRVLGQPRAEQHDVAYHRVRWKCGCTATGLTMRELHVKWCLLHRRPTVEARLSRARSF